MKFKLETAGCLYKKEDKEKLEKLGFIFDSGENSWEGYRYRKKRGVVVEIEISSMEELVDFVREHGDIVFSGNTIEIYDDYRE